MTVSDDTVGEPMEGAAMTPGALSTTGGVPVVLPVSAALYGEQPAELHPRTWREKVVPDAKPVQVCESAWPGLGPPLFIETS